MQYIYESPDNGKTVYRRPIDQPDAERELVSPEDIEDPVKSQLEFVQWLKDNLLYNLADSSYTMQRMHDVWATMKEQQSS